MHSKLFGSEGEGGLITAFTNEWLNLIPVWHGLAPSPEY